MFWLSFEFCLLKGSWLLIAAAGSLNAAKRLWKFWERRFSVIWSKNHLRHYKAPTTEFVPNFSYGAIHVDHKCYKTVLLYKGPLKWHFDNWFLITRKDTLRYSASIYSSMDLHRRKPFPSELGPNCVLIPANTYMKRFVLAKLPARTRFIKPCALAVNIINLVITDIIANTWKTKMEVFAHRFDRAGNTVHCFCMGLITYPAQCIPFGS